MDVQPNVEQAGVTPKGTDDTRAGPWQPTHGTVSETGARVVEVVAKAPRESVGGRAHDGDQVRPVGNASRHIQLGPAMASPEGFQTLLGKMLVDRGLITNAELDRALERQQETGERLGDALVKMDAVASGDVARVLAERLLLPFVDLGDDVSDRTVVGVISAEIAQRYVALPVARWGERIVIAMANPTAEMIDKVRRLVKAPVVVAVADPVVLRTLIATVHEIPEGPADTAHAPTVRANVGVPPSEDAATVAFTCPGCQQELTLLATPWVMTELIRRPGRYYVWDDEPGNAKPAHVCPRT